MGTCLRQPKTRRYIDVNNKERKIVYVGPSFELIDWSPKLPISKTSSKWKLEDGSIVQIPDNVWQFTAKLGLKLYD